LQGIYILLTKFEVSRGLLLLGIAGYLLSCLVPFGLYLLKNVPRYIPVAAELLITGGLYLLLSEMDGTIFEFFNVPFLTLGYLSAGWHTLWVAAAVFVLPVVFPAGSTDLSPGMFADATANLLTLLGIGFCFQKLVVSYHKIKGMYGIIQEQNATLEVYAKQMERLTLAEERNRLSRDLHDTVGHTFTTTIMGMDAVYYLIDVAPQEAKQNLRELLHITRNGLDEVRGYIHGIAPDREEQSLVLMLKQMSNEFAQHTGMKVLLEPVGAEYAVSEQVRLTLIRCLQESLTNAKRHGMASLVQSELVFRQDSIMLRIEDNGKGTDELTKGFGLGAMMQRVANLNGTLEWVSSSGKGMVIICVLPVMTHILAQKMK
jgi:signal transduction histidine kinase